jgi:phosphoglycerol transferase MdoB-like AlkP superfamily enzyme
VHPIYNDETKLEKGVKELEKRLTTTNWSRTDEAKLMKEIDQVKSSKPFFEKIAKIRAKIADLRTKKDEIRNEMAPTNKIINSLKGRIDKVKSEESVFDKDKQLKQYDLTNVRVQIDKVMEKKRDLITKKRQAKEDFYGRMCEYEIQQCLIKDIEWITQTKLMVVEKNERQSKYDQERRERNETRKKLADERKKKDDEYKAKQEERRREQEQKRKEWELQQLE